MGFFSSLGLGAVGSFALFLGYNYVQLQRQRRTLSVRRLRDFATLTAPALLRQEDRALDQYGDQITFVFQYYPYTDWGGNPRVKGALYLTLYARQREAHRRGQTAEDHLWVLYPDPEYRMREFVDFRTTERSAVLLVSESRFPRRFVTRLLKSLTIDDERLEAHFQRVSHRPCAPVPAVAVQEAAPVNIPEPQPLPSPTPALSTDDDGNELQPITREQLPYRGKWALVRTGRWIVIRMGPGGCERQDVFFGTYSYVDRNGKILGEYSYAEEFGDDGRALVEANGKRGYIDENGQWLENPPA